MTDIRSDRPKNCPNLVKMADLVKIKAQIDETLPANPELHAESDSAADFARLGHQTQLPRIQPNKVDSGTIGNWAEIKLGRRKLPET